MTAARLFVSVSYAAITCSIISFGKVCVFVEKYKNTFNKFQENSTVAINAVAIGNPERHVRRAAHRGSKQQ